MISNPWALMPKISTEMSVLSAVYYVVWSADCVVGALCCYLNFKMNDYLYHRVCVFLHSRCRRMCAAINKKQIVDAQIDERAQTLRQYLLDHASS